MFFKLEADPRPLPIFTFKKNNLVFYFIIIFLLKVVPILKVVLNTQTSLFKNKVAPKTRVFELQKYAVKNTIEISEE